MRSYDGWDWRGATKDGIGDPTPCGAMIADRAPFFFFFPGKNQDYMETKPLACAEGHNQEQSNTS